ncbi:MAG TPA: creatininase family protein [Alphaproteobacteria bacterium]|nr:creatininase family protein [Alphaproteobacteria bacterium]
MRIVDMNWMQVEAYLKGDDRCILPIGSVEQHAYLSLGVDAILAEKVALDAAEPTGVPVYPVVSYGITPYFSAFPGTISMRVATALAVARDILDGVKRSGFRRVLIVNGHGGNNPVGGFAQEWMADNPGMSVKFHNWWNAPKTWAKVQEIDTVASHASWMENFPWTRLPNVKYPDERKPMVNLDLLKAMDPGRAKAYLGDGNFGGYHRRDDEEMLALWDVAVAETRDVLEGPWPK